MWVADIRIWHKDSMVIEKSKGLDVWYACYYLNSYEKGGVPYVARVILVFGKDAQKYIEALEADKRFRYMDVVGNRVYLISPVMSNFHALVMDKSVFFVKPTVVKAGFEYWQVGSLDKKPIKELVARINRLKPKASAKLLSLKEREVNLFLPEVFRLLTPKQRWAYDTACKYGYYAHPRKNDLKSIAFKEKVPESTFRTHLRLAESKLLPSLQEFVDFGPKS